jgi:outer membrane receptor protein involved in Fe transport
MRGIFTTVFCFLLFHSAYTQVPGGNRGGARQMNAGRFYGKVVDASTGKGIEFATVQLSQSRMDSVTHSMKNTLVSGALTATNGDFSIDKLPVFGEYNIKITFFGYQPYENKISFELKPGMQGNMEQALNAIDKDLGNISLKRDTVTLAEVVVEGEEPPLTFSIDKKVYNVEKNPVNAGGTAVDVMKNVPTVSVDIDGNVTVRNSSPQIFIDGRPTPLTLDQIPADAISSVELITNPSAKYDASGGGAGILNIVLKKSKRIGYSGSVRAGVDSYGKINAGGDINARENKINIFLGANYNQRRSKSTTETVRNYFGDETSPAIIYNQNTNSDMNGYFGMLRGGIDYFMDNRNTLTLSGTFNRGKFNPVDDITTVSDTVSNGMGTLSRRHSSTEREFTNNGFTTSFKHLFPKAGNEWTADFNFNRNSSDYLGLYDTKNFDTNGNSYETIRQEMHGTSGNRFITFQSDYTKPVTEKIKIESGVRTSIKTFESETNNYILNNSSGALEIIPNQTNNYNYTENIYAGYFTFTNALKKFGYMLGLRLESSQYTGKLFNQSLEFTNDYPISAFPSGFLSYKFSENNDLQFNYTRRINRPNFFQILPYTDYSDSLNLSRGNPALKPEFTNSFELSHQRIFSNKFNLLSSIYLKYTTGLITRYQKAEFDTVLDRSAIINTYVNANSSYAYGAELVMKYTFSKQMDVTLNINAYNAVINGENIESNLSNEQFTWFAKMNTNIKLPKNFTVQVSGDYTSESALNVNGGDSRGNRGGGSNSGMGGGFGGGSQSTIQGFNKPNYGVDLAIKKEFLKDKTASVSLSISDLFDTKKNETYSESFFFTQNNLRRRDPRVMRLNLSYRFGKFDVSLFKRKNTRVEDSGGEM